MPAELNKCRRKAMDNSDETLKNIMLCLSPSERRVLTLWLGLPNGIGQAINDPSITLNISREKARRH
jgi:hypothetical protein